MRVISGVRRGKKLLSPAGEDTRPTLDSVKESLFDIIQYDVEGSRAADLFGGSGQLAIEAISRGAVSAVVCESSQIAAEVILKNIKACDFTDKISLLRRDAISWVSSYRGTPFGLVFIDPPYGSGLCEKALLAITQNSAFLASGATVTAETEAGRELPDKIGGLVCEKSRRYGKVMLWLYRRNEE